MILERKDIVSKFGGSSLADANRIRRVAEIMDLHSDRRYVVVSAPGKRDTGDKKITDLLLRSHELVEQGLSFDEAFAQVADRFRSIGTELHCYSVFNWLDEVHRGIKERKGRDWIASRGEWLMAQVFTQFLGGSFVDAANLIRLKENGQVDPLTYELIHAQLLQDSVYQVIPGFYGATCDGRIKVFPRGGSDITGAIIAKGVNARLYENWTDVDGVCAADPRVVQNPKVIRHITYQEMRELGYRGADVLQQDTILPVVTSGIPIHIRNTFNRNHSGSVIGKERPEIPGEDVIGLAGKSGFTAFQIEKLGMNRLSGIGAKLLDVFGSYPIPFEQIPMGLDAMSLVVREEELDGQEQNLCKDVHQAIQPDTLTIIRNLGLICVVGQGIRYKSAEVAGRLFGLLASAKIEVKTISYGSLGNNIVVGIDGTQVQEATRMLYSSFIDYV